MSAGSIKAGEAFVRIWADDAQARAALKTLQGKVKRFADDVSAMGKRVAAVGVAMAAPFVVSARTFAGFADQMSTVKAVTAATDAEFQRLNATAKKLGETTSFTAREAAEGMLALARAGFTADENIAALPDTLNLARAGTLGLGEASTILADTSRSFGIAANQSERVADALAKAANVSNTDIRLIGDSMKHVASSANLSGQNLEKMSAALAVMANRGIKGEMAGTALRKVLLELANAKKQAILKAEFGIDTKDAQGNMRDLMDVMRDLSAATANMGNADKLALFKDLFDTRGLQSAVTLTDNIAEWERLTDTIENASGTARQMAQEMDNNLGGSFRLMMSAIEGVQIAIGEATQGTLREWMASIQNAAQAVSSFVTSNQDFVAGVMKIGAVLLVGGVAVLAFGKGLKIAAGAVGALSSAAGGLKSLQDRITGLSAAEKAHAAALKEKQSAQDAYDSALKRQTAAMDKVAGLEAKQAASARELINAKVQLGKAEADLATATLNATQRKAAAEAAYEKQAQATAAATEARLKLAQAKVIQQSNPSHGADFVVNAFSANSAQMDKNAAAARAAYAAETKRLSAAQKELEGAQARLVSTHNGVTKAENAAAQSSAKLAQEANKLAAAKDGVSAASGRLNTAGYAAAEATERLGAAMSRAQAPAQNFQRGMALMGQSAASLRQAATHAGDAVRAVLGPAFTGIGRAASQAASALDRTFSPALTRMRQGVAGAANGLRRVLVPAASAAGGAVSRAAGVMRDAFGQAAAATGQAVGSIANAMGRALAPAANLAEQAVQRVAGVMNRVIGPAAGSVKAAMDKVGQSFRQAAQSAAAFGQAAVGAMGSPKVAAAAGSVAMLAGSISMLAGDSSLGKVMQWIATIAGIGMAASGAVAGVQALRAAMQGMSAGAHAATVAFLKLAAAIAVAFAAYKAGEWINHKVSGFDAEEINKEAKRFARVSVDESGDDLLKAQQKILSRIGDLRRKEAEQGWDLGAFRLVNPFGDNKALNEEINALERELEGVEEQYRAQTKAAEAAKKAADEAAETERIEANRQAVKDLADAWDDVLKKLEEVEKARADRARDKRFDADVEADPYAAKDQASGRFEEAKAAEEALVKRLHELEATRQELLSGGEADTSAVTTLQAEIESVLAEYEKAVGETDVWERFYEKADDAVTRTREALKRLAEDAKKLDLDHAKKQDDARFKDLLKNDWVSAADEVAQAMARVNADWLATGQRIAELQAKAEAGDIGAQRELAEALERRKELASERGGLEGRQKEVDSAQRAGERRFDGVRKTLNDEARYQARDDWGKAAEHNPVAANAALDAFIADLESQLANTGALAEQARTAQDYAGASAYDEQAKAIAEQLSELRGMKGQAEERDAVTGDFSARAMEAMMRGGGGQSLEKQQLETQQSMNERLGKLVDLYAAPTVVAVD